MRCPARQAIDFPPAPVRRVAALALACGLAFGSSLAGCGEPEPIPTPERNPDGTLTTDEGFPPEANPDPRVGG